MKMKFHIATRLALAITDGDGIRASVYANAFCGIRLLSARP